jgi:hypothetical protein
LLLKSSGRKLTFGKVFVLIAIPGGPAINIIKKVIFR